MTSTTSTTPATNASVQSHKSAISTPASSPPPPEEVVEKDVADAVFGVSDTMQKEEEQMRQKREKEDAVRDRRLKKERRKDVEGGPEKVDAKFKALEYLLSQSKVGLSTLAE